MPLAHSLQGAPPWFQDYVQELIAKSRNQGREPYLSHGKLSKQKNEAIRSEIENLLKSQQGTRYDIIPFSVTGSSKPINLSPDDLRHIMEDEGFARRIYESTTGIHNITKNELQDLRIRARENFEAHIPEIRKIEEDRRNFESQREPLESRIHELQSQRHPLVSQLSRLNLSRSEIEGKLKEITGKLKEKQSEVDKMVPYSAHAYAHHEPSMKIIQQLNNEIESLKPVIDKIDSERSEIESLIGKVDSERSEIESNLPNIKPEDIFKRASVEREISRLQGETGRIAPMNEIHERAINMLESSFNDDTMKLAEDELRESKRHNELRAVEPLVRSSLEGPTDEYMNKYVNDYTKDIRKAIEDESEEEFLKKVAPKINMSFAQMGAFHSGARAKALKEAANDHRVKLHREIAHLTGSARDKAMEHHELQKRREQGAASQLSQTIKSEKEAGRQQSELMRHHAVTKHGMKQLDVAALGQIAKAKQEQLQHEKDVERQEYERELLHPQEQLSREAAFVTGLPAPSSQTLSGNIAAAPPPPNLFTPAAGVIASLASNVGQQQRPYKKGGSVRKNYASGGSIGSDEIGNEIRNIIRSQEESGREHLNQTSNQDPMKNWLRHVGREMLSNPSEDPLLSLGRGTSNAMDHNDMMKERAANLYDKIQSTKLNQYKVLAEYENMKEQTGLKREQLSETNRYHNQHLALQKAGNLIKSTNSSMIKPKNATERKLESDAKKDLFRSMRMKKELEHIGSLLNKTSTGPVIGGIKGLLPKTKIDNQIEVGTNKLILDMHQGMKNIPRSEEFMKRIETTKPNRSNYPEANNDALNLMREGANDVEENSISTLLSMGWTPQKIEKQFKVKVPEHFLEESSLENPNEGIEEETLNENNQIINMVDPDGNPLMVPIDQVEQALRIGATVAE